MNDPLWHPKCPLNQKATIICLSHNCPQTPFQCSSGQCSCNSVHNRCKTMQWQAVKQYLLHWKNNICKESRQFIGRMQKIFANLKGRLEREEKLFQDYCKQIFLGKDFIKLMYLLEKKEQKSVTTTLFSSALRNLTQPIKNKSFSNFTISQMKNIDKAADNLFSIVDQLYHSKQQQTIEIDKIKRSNSAVLQRTTKNMTKSAIDQDFGSKSFIKDIVSLKLDLTFPKNINSKIVQEASALNKILNRKVKKYHLTYRASQSSFRVEHFYHTMAVTRSNLVDIALKNGKKTDFYSLILTKNQYGKVLGGFTPLVWQEPKGGQQSDQEDNLNPQIGSSVKKMSKFKSDPSGKTSFFSLDLMQKYDLKRPEEAIYCGRRSIGFGKGDLKILDKGNLIRKNSCKFPMSFNYTHKPYSNWSKSSMELGGGRYSVYFKLTEWQSFLVQF